MIDVSIVLVSYNTKELTFDCLKSVYEKTVDLNFDVYVVDNNSQDGSCEMIEKEFPQVKLIKNNQNLGFGTANNLAIKASTARYLFLLNTDTILVNNAIKILFDFMESNRDCGACGGNLYNKEMEHVRSFGYIQSFKTKILKTLQLSFLFREEYKKINERGLNLDNELKEVDSITGADLMLRKSVLDEVGIFDEDFFLYFEETELQFRIKQANHKIYINPESKIIHLESKSTKNKKLKREIFLKSEYLFYKKCYQFKKKDKRKLIIYLSHFVRLLSQPKTILNVWKFMREN